jgi:hypothetical protein
MIIVVCFFFSFTVSVSGFGGRFGENWAWLDEEGYDRSNMYALECEGETAEVARRDELACA